MPDDHATEIDQVTGPVHTDSGDINVTGDQSVTSAEVRGTGAIAQGYRSAAASWRIGHKR